MNAHTQDRDYWFGIGLLSGTFIGVGLAMWLVPRLRSELRERMTDSARSLGNRASERYQQASTHVGEAVDELTRKGQDVRDDLAGAVARGATRWSGMPQPPKAIVSVKPGGTRRRHPPDTGDRGI